MEKPRTEIPPEASSPHEDGASLQSFDGLPLALGELGLAAWWRNTLPYSTSAGDRAAALAASAVRLPNAFPITPSAGPPPHSPAESPRFVIEMTVARTLESSMLELSQVEYTGPARERNTRVAQKVRTARAKLPAKANASVPAMVSASRRRASASSRRG